MPLEFNQPVTDISTPALNANNAVPWTFQVPPNIRLGTFGIQLSVTKSAKTSVKSVPLLTDAVSQVTLLVNSVQIITRTLDQLFGRQGLNALNDANNGGTVQYFQAGVAITAAAPNGITYGALPVLIGSPADLAIQAALTADTDTVGVFGLPILFSEDYRKSYTAANAMALPTAMANAQGTIASNIGPVVFQFTMNPLTGVAGNFSAASMAASVEFDNQLAALGASIQVLKQPSLAKQYSAAGNIELADQINNKLGDRLQVLSLLTVSDPITMVTVKQGQTIIRQYTWEDNLLSLRKSGVNVDAIPRNRFDLVADRSDDPTSGWNFDPNNKLSVVATLASANDAAKTVTILPQIFSSL